MEFESGVKKGLGSREIEIRIPVKSEALMETFNYCRYNYSFSTEESFSFNEYSLLFLILIHWIFKNQYKLLILLILSK
jgi:hypothetical protein